MAFPSFVSFSPRTLAFAFSFAISISFSSPSLAPPRSSPQSVAADLVALLGSANAAKAVPAAEASALRSCLRFLVPAAPHQNGTGRREALSFAGSSAAEDELVWWPPTPVMELARLAVDSGGDPGAIQRCLDPTMLPVPDVEGLKKDKCELTRTPYGRRFANKEINSYLAFLFKLIVKRGPDVGLNVTLSRYDLFHGHIFLATNTGRLGILFHAREYPAYDKKVFPYNLGYCQTGSDVEYDDSMNLRNILWLAPMPSISSKSWEAPGVLVILDARPDGIIYRDLIPDYVQLVRTIYEDDFGEIVADVNYLNVRNSVVPADDIFIC